MLQGQPALVWKSYMIPHFPVQKLNLLPALLTLLMSYLSRYRFWIGCFAICSFSTMTEIYSDFRGLIWRSSTVGGQTLSVPNKFLFFPAEHTLNSACFGIGGQENKACAFLNFIVIKPQSLAARTFQRRGAVLLWPVCWIPADRWLFVLCTACAVMVRGKKGSSEGEQQELSEETLRG